MLYWICLTAMLTTQTPLTLSVGVDAAEPVRFAAEEFRRYITEAAGVKVELLEDAALSSHHALLLAAPRQHIETLQFPQSNHEEAYRVYTPDGGGRVFSANAPRALLYAVYDFLETSLGYRWYFPYPEDNITPSLSPAAFDRLLQTVEDRETEPAFSFRSREFRDVAPTTDKTDGLIVHQIDWWAKLRMNRFLLNFNYASNTELWARWQTRILPEIKRRGMLVGLGEHGSYPLFLPPHRYANDHPEWYCEIDGKRIGAMHTESGDWAQFCTTNPEAVATYLENFAAFVQEHPEVERRRRERAQIVVLTQRLLPHRVGVRRHPAPVSRAGRRDGYHRKEPPKDPVRPSPPQDEHQAIGGQHRPHGDQVIDVAHAQEQRQRPGQEGGPRLPRPAPHVGGGQRQVQQRQGEDEMRRRHHRPKDVARQPVHVQWKDDLRAAGEVLVDHPDPPQPRGADGEEEAEPASGGIGKEKAAEGRQRHEQQWDGGQPIELIHQWQRHPGQRGDAPRDPPV